MLKITKVQDTSDVYDLTSAHNHNFYANEILVHNCMEIALPTRPLKSMDDTSPAIALCTLAAINAGDYVDLDDLPKMERRVDLLVRALNELLDYQNYPMPAAEAHTKKFRPLGIGISNLAYWLAAKGYNYSRADGLNDWSNVMESLSYYAIKSSMTLAKEKGGACPGFKDTRWAKGQLPIHRYAPGVDELVHPSNLVRDWNALTADVVEHGMYNTTLLALMPIETSSQIGGMTNGMEAPKSLVSVKGGDGEGSIRFVVPHIHKLKNKYELMHDQPSCEGYLKYNAVSQKFVCQSISTSTYYNPANFESGLVPIKQLIRDDLQSHKWGVKSLYYCWTEDGAGDQTSAATPDEMEVEDVPEADCDSCKL